MRSWVLKCVAVGGCAAVLAMSGACSGSGNTPTFGDDGGGADGSSGSGGGSTSSSSGAASSGGGSGGGTSSGSSGVGGSNGGSGGGSTSSSSGGGSTSSGSGGGSNSGSGGGTSSSGGSSSGSGSTSSSGGGSGSSSGGTDPITAARQECVATINQYRASVGSAPLTENTGEESCVDGQAKADEMSMTPHSAFGQCQEFAQNECPGWPGPPTSIMAYMMSSCLDQMWAEGPPPQGQDNHWLNMENPQYTKVACGFYQAPDGSWWATQDFW